MKTLLSKLFLAFFVSLAFISCTDKANNGRIIVRLTDSPGDYEAVNVDIQGVQIHRQVGNSESGWIDLDVNAGIYNLLELTDGVETVIADSHIPSGAISQLRLILGPNNSVVINGVETPLQTPSAMQSGLKLLVNEMLTEGITYSVLLDFDADKSVVRGGGAGVYNLKPVIRTVTEARDGAIEGTVLPASLNVAVYAMFDGDTLGTSYATENSANFFIGGLDAGNYDLVFDPGELSTFKADTIKNVSVAIGQITQAGEITLVE
ncbi:MAG: DUF4382 domain-containing protein [Cyclobacteriaceae bacterium]|nr:DUF4382 domain-containing protein [Cyclobacteriaceae bacterium]